MVRVTINFVLWLRNFVLVVRVMINFVMLWLCNFVLVVRVTINFVMLWLYNFAMVMRVTINFVMWLCNFVTAVLVLLNFLAHGSLQFLRLFIYFLRDVNIMVVRSVVVSNVTIWFAVVSVMRIDTMVFFNVMMPI